MFFQILFLIIFLIFINIFLFFDIKNNFNKKNIEIIAIGIERDILDFPEV